MRLLEQSAKGGFQLTGDLRGPRIPHYAILSHTWGDDEVTFEDVADSSYRNKAAYRKLQFCGEQAERDGFRYFWVDSCCIKRSSDSELSESLNSMFRWYQGAEKCYVYLSDVSTGKRRASEEEPSAWEEAFEKSRWFRRGWTLQELVAPKTVEFFSREGVRLGDKRSLEKQIHDITSIPTSALRGSSLTEFSEEERFHWAANRETSREEDEAYCLLGIFNISMPVIYGEGKANAVRRLKKEVEHSSQSKESLRLLYVTNPRMDKTRIEETKGGLIPHSHQWLLDHEAFKVWQSDPEAHMFWIRGDPGKGKTMLVCGIINTLLESSSDSRNLSFFFCQATDTRLDNSTSVLRGLLWFLISQQPSLASHVQKQYENANTSLFEDANAWVTLSGIFVDVLRDPTLKPTILVIDALDECAHGLPKLLDFIVQHYSASPQVKWLVSSRNWPQIKEQLDKADNQVTMWLELNAKSISAAVHSYIQIKVDELAQQKNYNEKTKDTISSYLLQNANDTYLWVALVCENLSNVHRTKALARLVSFPPGLDFLYRQMLEQIGRSDDSELCNEILAIVSTVYIPITVPELVSFLGSGEDFLDDMEYLHEVIGLCGSFLVVKEGTIYFVHQSAKEYLLKNAGGGVLPCGEAPTHYRLFTKMLAAMDTHLRRDMYGLCQLGFLIADVRPPHPDPLASMAYSCNYWLDHLCAWSVSSYADEKAFSKAMEELGAFINTRFLFWIEALSLLRTLSRGLNAINRLRGLVKERTDTGDCLPLIEDARRFIMFGKTAIEVAPLQAYGSVLIFSPAQSLIRQTFEHEIPTWVKLIPKAVETTWSNCLMTLDGHRGAIISTALSHDQRLVASMAGGTPKQLKIWDLASGACLLTKSIDDASVVTFTPENNHLVTIARSGNIQTWNSETGELLRTWLGKPSSFCLHAISPNSKVAASSSSILSFGAWNTRTGRNLYSCERATIEFKEVGIFPTSSFRRYSCYGHSAVAISKDCILLASGIESHTLQVSKVRSGELVWLLEGHERYIIAVQFSDDSTMLASADGLNTVKLWNLKTGELLQSLNGRYIAPRSLVFSRDSKFLMSISMEETHVWAVESGVCISFFEHPSQRFALHGRALGDFTSFAISGYRGLVTLFRSSSRLPNLQFEVYKEFQGGILSEDLTKVAYTTLANTIVVCNVDDYEDAVRPARSFENKDTCHIFTHEGHMPRPVSFSPDSALLATRCHRMMKIWSLKSDTCLLSLDCTFDSNCFTTFSPDSAHLASTSKAGTIHIWDTTSGECMQTLKDIPHSLASLSFSQDSSTLLVRTYNSSVALQGLESSSCDRTLSGLFGPIISATFSDQSTKLALTSWDNTIRVWDIHSGKCDRTIEPNIDLYAPPAFSSDLARMALVASEEGTEFAIKIWDILKDICVSSIPHQYVGSLRAIAISPDWTQVAATPSNAIKIYRVHDRKCTHMLKGHTRIAESLHFLRNSQTLVSSSWDRTIRIWDLSTEPLPGENGDFRDIKAICLSKDGTKLVSRSDDMDIKVWDAFSGQMLRSLNGHRATVNLVILWGGSDRILTAAFDAAIKAWDINTGECLFTLKENKSNALSLAVTADGTRLASGLNDQSIKIWDLDKTETVLTLEGHGSMIFSLAFSCDGSRVASSSKSTIWIWDATNGSCLKKLDHWNNLPLPRLLFSPTSRDHLVSLSRWGSIQLWHLAAGTSKQISHPKLHYRAISFDHSGSSLCTDRGAHPLKLHPASETADVQLEEPLGLGLSGDEQWITYHAKPVLWLPPDHRTTSPHGVGVAIYGSRVYIASGTGRILVFEFDVPYLESSIRAMQAKIQSHGE